MPIRKVAVHLCLTLIIKGLKIIIEHDKVVTTLNILFSVVPQLIMPKNLSNHWSSTAVTREPTTFIISRR
jgi:hypothetical protein